LIDSAAYFHDAVAYVLLNPLRTVTPLATSPEAYRWSSASLVCSDATPSEFAAALLASLGGVDDILASLPPSRIKASQEHRRSRLEALASGSWMEKERSLAERTPQLYRQLLATRAVCEPVAERDLIRRSIPAAGAVSAQAARMISAARRVEFTGVDLDEAIGAISHVCRSIVPSSFGASTERLTDVIAYALWRFTSASVERIAEVLEDAAQRIEDLLLDLRRARKLDAAWTRLLWAIEWSLRWQLRAAPHRA
jgi:hypothetical protein